MCSGVSAAVDGVLASVGGTAQEILVLVELIDRAQAALAERVGVFDASEGWAADGEYSFACWLRARADVTRAESLQLGRFARTLRTMPHTEQAVRDGKLSVAKARLLAGVVNERTAERFAEQEGFLVDQVQGLTVDDTKMALDYWKRLADTDGPDPADPTRNWAQLSPGYGGRWHLEADLDPVSGSMVKAVLDAIVDRMHQDGRFADLAGAENTCGRRMADGFVEMANRAAGAGPDQPAVHPDVVVVVPHSALTRPEPDPFDPPFIVGGGPITVAEVFRLALLGTVSTLTVDQQGRPLNLGRKQRLASSNQWIAATVRDRGCVAPGLRPPRRLVSAPPPPMVVPRWRHRPVEPGLRVRLPSPPDPTMKAGTSKARPAAAGGCSVLTARPLNHCATPRGAVSDERSQAEGQVRLPGVSWLRTAARPCGTSVPWQPSPGPARGPAARRGSPE